MGVIGKVVLVTGASRGIGRATAAALDAAGAQVVACARDEAALAETPALLRLPCDVTDPAQVDALFSEVGRVCGRLDAVFNNAGANLPCTNFGDIDVDTWRRVVSVNLDGAFLVARGAFAMMRDQDPHGGRIINNGSISAYVPRPGSAPYTASKHAITGLTRSISLDGRAYDIACGQIDIGNAASEMTASMAAGVPQADGSMKAEPLMDVAHVADAVVHMAGLPLSANVQFMTVMATNMPFIGRG
jgi:NAD(P)-dependent dehydrogenase (short-subunit alcohol dehydrogenase family)